MLMLDLIRLQWQEKKIAFLPVDPLTIDDGVSAALLHINDDATLMAMLAASRTDFVLEDMPVLQRRVRVYIRIEEVLQPSLARHEDWAIGEA